SIHLSQLLLLTQMVMLRVQLIIVFLFNNALTYASSPKNNITFIAYVKASLNENHENVDFYKASLFFSQQNWDSTLYYTLKAQNDYLDPISKDYNYAYRGISFRRKKLFKAAEEELNNISENFKFYTYTKAILGEIALEQELFRKSISHFQEVLQLDSSRIIGFNIVNPLHNLGLCYLHLGKFDSASIYLQRALKISQGQQDTISMIRSYGDLANLYYEQYKDDLAIPYFEKAYQLAKSTDHLEQKQNTALNMAVVEENRNNYKLSLAYRKEYENWSDTLNDQNRVWEIAQKEKQFEVAQKQLEVDFLEVENQAKIAERNGLLYTALALFTLLVVGGYLYREKVKNNRTIAAQKEELNELNNTKDKLFSVVSHDLRTSVNTLKVNHDNLRKSYASQKSEQVESLLHTNSALANSTYNLLDNLFQWALMQTKQAYFSIESMRLFFIVEQVAANYESLFRTKNINFENLLDKKTVIQADQESFKIVLRNLLDNAVKYTNSGGKIEAYLQNNSDTHCELVISDNGKGMSKEAVEVLQQFTELSPEQRNVHVKGSGLGLQLCHVMILKNNGQLTIKSKEGTGTQMIITLPKTTAS
ncbi:MAG: tetratricopeptide repeat-containing sensor histidine kinase, partial [Bacteroidota bacterium]